MTPNKPVKWRWMFYGGVFGLVVVLADILFGWRGTLYEPWTNGDAIASNAVQGLTTVLLAAIAGFIAGIISDRIHNI